MVLFVKYEEKNAGRPHNAVAFCKTWGCLRAKPGEKTGGCDILSGNGTDVPLRRNSPSILEGVPGGRGSNISIRESPCEILKRGISRRGSNIKH